MNAPLLTTVDAAEIEFFSEQLKTQPNFPPAMIEYQAGWYAPADDDRPHPNLPENTLLSSRLLIGNGVHGFNYFPLQDTFTPAGYSVPWANRSYRWDAALSPGGDPQPRLEAVRRNSQLLRKLGARCWPRRTSVPILESCMRLEHILKICLRRRIFSASRER